MKIISWNLLHRDGAALADVERLVHEQQPDVLLMQEVTTAFEALPRLVGGHYAQTPLPGRRHGLAAWTREAMTRTPGIVHLPSGAVVHRICQIVDLGGFSAANVHLSQGQLLNRRQLRHVADHLPLHAAILGDYNLVGPPMLAGFQDVGPRQNTHRMSDLVPLRLDRCLTRGLICLKADVLDRGSSDHRPIMVELVRASEVRRPPPMPRLFGQWAGDTARAWSSKRDLVRPKRFSRPSG